MTRLPTTLALAAFMTACTAQQLASPSGQLFCAVQTAAGPLVVAAIDARASTAGAPVAILATNATRAFVDAVCAKAGGVAVAPPLNPAAVPLKAVVVP